MPLAPPAQWPSKTGRRLETSERTLLKRAIVRAIYLESSSRMYFFNRLEIDLAAIARSSAAVSGSPDSDIVMAVKLQSNSCVFLFSWVFMGSHEKHQSLTNYLIRSWTNNWQTNPVLVVFFVPFALYPIFMWDFLIWISEESILCQSWKIRCITRSPVSGDIAQILISFG